MPAKILIVEDEAVIAEQQSATLRQLGYEVVGVTGSAEEALASIAATAPDVVLVDINLGPFSVRHEQPWHSL